MAQMIDGQCPNCGSADTWRAFCGEYICLQCDNQFGECEIKAQKKRLENYPKFSDGTIDISKIPNKHRCNACQIGCQDNCDNRRCDCHEANHGVPQR